MTVATAPPESSPRIGSALELPVLAFAALLFSNAVVVATQSHGLPQSVAVFTMLLLALPVAVHLLFHGREPVTVGLPHLLVYFGVLCLSTAVSARPSVSLEALAIFLTEGLILYVMMTNAVHSIATLRRVLLVVVAVAVALSLLSIWQEVTGTYDQPYLGFAQTSPDTIRVGEDLYGKVMRGRLGGPIGSPNRYAQILVVALPLAVFAGLAARRRRTWALAWASVGAIAVGIMLTFSRGAMVGVAVVGAVTVLLGYVRLRHALLLAVLLLTIMVLAVPQFSSRLLSITTVTQLGDDTEGQPDGAIRGRATSNVASWQVFLENPILGVGPLQYFKEHSQQTANQLGMRFFHTQRRAHNLYAEVAADTGILGVAAFLALPVALGRRLHRLGRELRGAPESFLAHGLVVSLVGYFATAVFLHLSYQRYYWFLIALAASGVAVLSEQRPPPDARSAVPV
jgi:putative inorganic carbon (hco3(-)) transporter